MIMLIIMNTIADRLQYITDIKYDSSTGYTIIYYLH